MERVYEFEETMRKITEKASTLTPDKGLVYKVAICKDMQYLINNLTEQEKQLSEILDKNKNI